MRTHAARRGQSLVETSLGLMVFVTILLFGIYFAEVGAITLKVQEAANFALWDATAHVQHSPESNEWQRDNAVSLAEAEASRRYQDFDGRESKGSGAVTLQQAIARATPIRVNCEAGLPNGLRGIAPGDAGGSSALAQSMTVVSPGMTCTASSGLSASRIGKFLEPPFHEAQRKAANAFTVCAAGRAKGGACPGRFALLLDDWGLAGVAEGRPCALNINGASRCANSDYYQWTQRVFRANGGGGGAGSALAALVGAPGVNEDQFFMSYRGEEDGYEENIGPTHAGGQSRWEVTPFHVPPGGPRYDVPRENSWLGGVPR
ncbi:hypothetical protein DRW03_10235 [Corallococcus sp. H22C18031201]|uniref:hypothetical protein n=1 Tax=Citreicoccus inhibens TaxID=2849499 RepID=UPI000E72B279|nr:hypothetical protein [Citreicoccus inhibens]MBU8899335.1 hypothetical protein [Citreicoccus inhibens]RJS23985.1 hypothetical protein DRW03_10235 [Corallococcus sp. H22C18031201]